MTQQPQMPPQGVSGEPESSDRAERRLIAAAVALLMRLPRVARYGLLALALAGGADLSGLDSVVLDALLARDPVVVRPAPEGGRCSDPSLRLERADQAELNRAR